MSRDAAGTSAGATGRSENRIFGNCVFPKNSANQVPPGLFPFRRLLLLQEPPVDAIEVLLGVLFGLSPTLRQSDESTADREATFFS